MENNQKKKKLVIHLLFGVYLLLGMIVSAVQLYSWITAREDLQILPG